MDAVECESDFFFAEPMGSKSSAFKPLFSVFMLSSPINLKFDKSHEIMQDGTSSE